jgi:hypothetical protein
VRVHLAREHALELELLDLGREFLRVGDHRLGGRFVGFGDRELEQLARLGDTAREPAEPFDDALEPRAFAPELLRTRRVVPDVRVLELARYFLEAFALRIEVKGTP